MPVSQLILSVCLSLAVLAPPSAHDGSSRSVGNAEPFPGAGMRPTAPSPSAPANSGSLRTYPSSGVRLLSSMTLAELGNPVNASDVIGYVAPSGREYALVATRDGTAIVEVSDPGAPVLITVVLGVNGSPRDVKTYAEMAYVGSPNGGGVQVLDLSNLDGGVVTELASILTGGLPNTHNLAVDADSGFLYRLGGAGVEGLRAYDLNQNLTAPPFVGEWQDMYLHDAQVVTYTSGPYAGRQIAFALGGLNSGNVHSGLRILDVTDKANPFLRREVLWPNNSFAHQGFLSADQQYLYINDELDETSAGLPTTTYVIDVSDLDNAFLASTFDNGNTAIGHNAYIRDDQLIAANNTSGLRVSDLSVDALSPPEVAWFDTREEDDLPTFNGLFGVDPFLPSGIVLGSDVQSGLFVWWVGDPLVELALVAPPSSTLNATGSTLQLTITELNPNDLLPGSAKLQLDTGSGYVEYPLTALGGDLYSASFPALTCPSLVSYYFCASSTNGVQWVEPTAGVCAPFQATVAASETVSQTFDFESEAGWVALNLGASAGDWVRGVPVNDPAWAFDPNADSDSSGRCWLTGNTLGDSGVNGGAVRIVSPELDLTAPGAAVQYDYYLYLTIEDGVDQLLVEANDNQGVGSWFQVARHIQSSGNCWRRNLITGADLANAGLTLTSTTRLRFTATESGTPSVLEAGIDAVRVTALACSTVATYCTAGTSANGCTALLSGSGTPSATSSTGFTLSASAVEGSKDGLFFYGTSGRQANTWGSGTSFQCVTPPVKRGGLLVGLGAPRSCAGSFAQDLNARWCPTCPKPNHNPGAGAVVQAQLWYRDPQNTSNQTTSLSDALEFTVSP